MTRFSYLFVGLVIGGLTLMASSLFGSELAGMVSAIQYTAHPALAEMNALMSAPIVWALVNPAFGAALAAVLWPVALFWLGMSGVISMASLGYGFALDLSFGLGVGAFF